MKKLLCLLTSVLIILTGCSTPKEKEEVSFDKEQIADIIIIGAGAAGLSSAIAAVENGATSVIVLEKTNSTGGSLNFTSGTISGAETIIQELDGIVDTNESYVEDIMFNSRDTADLDLIKTYAKKNTEVINWLWENGLKDKEFTPDRVTGTISVFAPEHELYSQKRSYKFIAENKEKYKSATHEILDQIVAKMPEITILYQTNAIELLPNDDNQVLSVLSTCKDQVIKYTANKGVILATGGYSGNTELLGAFTENGNYYLPGAAATADGYGIYMAQEVGAYIDQDKMSYAPTFPMGYKPEMGPGLIRPTYTFKTGGISVNQNGERFTDETSVDIVAREVALEEQPNAIQYEVFTDKVIEDLQAAKGDLFWKFFYAPGMPLHNQVLKGATVEELATKINVPTDNLVNTINKYNENVKTQTTDEFGRKYTDDALNAYNIKVNALEGDMYYAVPIQALCVMTMGGVTINELGQVIDNDKNVIPGLYAAGEVAGHIFGKFASSGTGVMGPVTFGQIAGENAMIQELAKDYKLTESSNLISKDIVTSVKEEVASRFDMTTPINDGTYSATVDGQEGPMVVEVEISSASISKVTIVESKETTSIAAPALQDIPVAIVDGNTVDVDVIIGATLTSNRIMDAVAICLKEAAK